MRGENIPPTAPMILKTRDIPFPLEKLAVPLATPKEHAQDKASTTSKGHSRSFPVPLHNKKEAVKQAPDGDIGHLVAGRLVLTLLFTEAP